MSRFETFLTDVVDRGRSEARADGSPVVEAHHLMLAIAAIEEPATREALSWVGLTYPRLRAALDREFEDSLAAAGVSLAGGGIPPASARDDSPDIGASAKLAMERGFASVIRKRDLRPEHLLHGILQAEVGTVPRALARAGIDRAALAERVRDSLAGGSDHGRS